MVAVVEAWWYRDFVCLHVTKRTMWELNTWVVSTESAPRISVVQTEAGDIVWWATGCVGGSGSSVCACKVGIDVISPVEPSFWCSCLVSHLLGIPPIPLIQPGMILMLRLFLCLPSASLLICMPCGSHTQWYRCVKCGSGAWWRVVWWLWIQVCSLVGRGLGLVVGVCESHSFVVVDCECLADCDVMVMSFMSPVCFSSSSLMDSSSPSLPSPSLPFSSLCLFLSSSSMSPSKFESLYPVAVGTWLVYFASQTLKCDLTVANMVQMWVGNNDGFSQHHLSSISWSLVTCSLMHLFAAIASFIAQSITDHFVHQSSHMWCWPD